MAAKPRSRKKSANQSSVSTAGSSIRIEVPQSSRHHQSKTRVVVSPAIIPASGFVQFLREHAIVGLAIGFVIGTQVQTLVKQLIDSFINPAFKLLFGEALTAKASELHFRGRVASFGWGSFAYALLDFLFVLVAVYMIVKSLKLDKLDQPKS
jgi:large-conductance mechanosensitive channel